MSSWIPTVRCNNDKCLAGKVIFLPYPSHLGKSLSQPDWPTDTWSRAIACPWCGHLYEYREHDVQWGQDGIQNPLPQNDFVRVLLLCDQENCGTPLEVFFPSIIHSTKESLQSDLRHLAETETCPKGHHLPTPIHIASAEAWRED